MKAMAAVIDQRGVPSSEPVKPKKLGQRWFSSTESKQKGADDVGSKASSIKGLWGRDRS